MAVQHLRRRTIILGIAVAGLIAVIPIAYSHYDQAGLQAVSIVATSLLTFALVVLYNQQHLTLRYQQEPQLEISDIQLYDNLETVNLDLSNFGGGPATSMTLHIGLYELSGDGPIQTVEGQLRRIERVSDIEVEKTMASSIQPSELSIGFEAVSQTVISMGGQTQGQKSLASILAEEFDKNRDVIYGRVAIQYCTNFSDENEYVADFSLQFTRTDEIECKTMGLLPWEDKTVRTELGG